MAFNDINKFVTDFIKQQEDIDSALDNWNSEETQTMLSNILVKTPGKRPKNAYQIFCSDHRDQLKQENTDKKASEITKMLAALWKEIKETDEELSSKYQKLANKEKGEKIGSTAPKKAKSAYIIFCQKNRDDVKQEIGIDAKATEITGRLAEMWNELKNDEDRSEEYQEYVDAAADDKKRYTEEVEALPEDQKPTPTRRGKSAYQFFCKSKRSEVKEEYELTGSELTKKLSELWNELKNDEDRADEFEEYKKLAADDKEKVKSEPVVIKPKRARSAYILFCQAHRAEVKSENPEMTTTEVTGELARMWNEIKEDEDNEEYQKYVELASEEKEKLGVGKSDKKPVEKKQEKKQEKKEEKKEEKKLVEKKEDNKPSAKKEAKKSVIKKK
jgi:hypothetical protein